MKLAIIIVILAFCYCGSCANGYPWSLLQPEEVGYLQRTTRLEEPDSQVSQLVDSEMDKKNIKNCKELRVMGCGRTNPKDLYRRKSRREEDIPGTGATSGIKEAGFENLVPRNVMKPKLLRLLQEYYGEPVFTSGYGDYGQE